MPHLGLSFEELRARCAAVELLVLDVDGVMTNGVIEIDDRGVETKQFFVRDGSALAFWRQAGHRAAILSGRRTAAVDLRAAELGIRPVLQGARDKALGFREILELLGCAASQACFVGDDLPDLRVMSVEDLGLAACPADAAPEVRDAAHIVTEAPGGRGAVREVVEIILKAQDRWTPLLEWSQAPP
jgi:3-deoxy-D-manno-octulosonate 8-phosphate phosphatase (KDO 8-P phosphatase)